ncbi:hypothetical protein AB5I41_08135 [Sphingomonas sp. MMS24-JH45]
MATLMRDDATLLRETVTRLVRNGFPANAATQRALASTLADKCVSRALNDAGIRALEGFTAARAFHADRRLCRDHRRERPPPSPYRGTLPLDARGRAPAGRAARPRSRSAPCRGN